MITLISLLFKPIDCKLLIFLILVCLLFKNYHNYFLACAQLLISGKLDSQYTLYSLIFFLLHSVINREQHEKYLYNQSSHYTRYRLLIVKACLIYQFKSGHVVWSWCITMLHFVSSCSNMLAAFQAKNNIRSTFASSSPTLVSHLRKP